MEIIHSKTPIGKNQKYSIEVITQDYMPLNEQEFTTTGNCKAMIATATICPSANLGLPLPISQEQPKNTKWTGIYSLSNSSPQELAKNISITVDIDFKKRIIHGTARLGISGGIFTLNAYFDEAGNVSELFDISTDKLVSHNVCGKIYQNYIELELRGVGSNSISYLGGLIACPPDE